MTLNECRTAINLDEDLRNVKFLLSDPDSLFIGMKSRQFDLRQFQTLLDSVVQALNVEEGFIRKKILDLGVELDKE